MQHFSLSPRTNIFGATKLSQKKAQLLNAMACQDFTYAGIDLINVLQSHASEIPYTETTTCAQISADLDQVPTPFPK